MGRHKSAERRALDLDGGLSDMIEFIEGFDITLV